MKTIRFLLIGLLLTIALPLVARAEPTHTIYLPLTIDAQTLDISPPAQPVKLIFIHHSTGENWLTDDYGNLGRELAANNYFVSDTNYGWGPDGIGDRTDIVNWREWFRSPSTPTYMQALFNESEQHANYTRTFGDPGGENQIVMFKSCFPNSALEGSPDDPPDPNEAFSVGHAKYVYNDLLNYFVTRPDKLFIVITAPPLQDATYADNARAFNNWLYNDWLAENSYPLNNVAVFDFYNVLTHPDNHHRINNGQIEHISNGINTLYYDSDGDDHPNIAGSQKATAEYIPLLNYYYHRWMETAPIEQIPPAEQPVPTAEDQTPPEGDAAPTEKPQPIVPLPPTSEAQPIDDFEGENHWQAFWDGSTATSITCTFTDEKAIGREQSMRIDFEVAADSWATCSLVFASIQDWSDTQGITFFYTAAAPALLFDVTIYSGSPEALTSYQYTIETVPESVNQWIPVELSWNQILGVDWEANARNPINPSQVTGVAIGFSTNPNTPNRGTIWVDSLRNWIPPDGQGQTENPEAESPTEGTGEQPQTESKTPPEEVGNPLCPASTSIGAIGLMAAIQFHQKKREKL